MSTEQSAAAVRDALSGRLRIPAIAAPMLGVSGRRLVSAVCREGVIGAFPTANARSVAELDEWLTGWERERDADDRAWAPWCANLIIRQPRLADDLEMLVRHRVEMVITSVGSPAPVVAPLQDAGAVVLADVASMHHAERAIAAGVDGLVLLTAGAGGQTGRLNPFAFVREVRAHFDGLVVLAGGIADGVALRAATALGADLGYLGTRFVAAEESLASDDYRTMLVESSMDDVVLTRAFTGLPSSMLRASIVAAGLDPDHLDEDVEPEDATALYGSGAVGPRRWRDIRSAGHTVSAVDRVEPAAALIARIAREYDT
ncbi:nitronate monooxygenase [Microbacterium sp. NPDC089320]|uniref:NAD(P)H-dependent flavin oxidoreductase n=1 Tax=Microbacterium sp. NPDC089320 TaxID=3155182 RepID=UPI003420D0D0